MKNLEEGNKNKSIEIREQTSAEECRSVGQGSELKRKIAGIGTD